MVLNLIGLLAESPIAIEAYQTLTKFFTQTSFTPTEHNFVWLAINYGNKCHDCMAAHTAIAKSEKIDNRITNAIRSGQPLMTRGFKRFARSQAA